ncbi:hypothetical protein G7062_01935 [Erysipelothrix sp. HDW6C]|uniref:MucBP domain-containing protein n=1 Tax=Erysipelothrix sp. HDW6C TaxID=2714930 RepID=UPI001409AC8D|nr:MucBP domain-containing protein [Erysipelothrix sp. HDW6C]QIK69116.1 hypothetical protein G7062_01935 [Erysipelothrix sp. HDW6C]
MKKSKFSKLIKLTVVGALGILMTSQWTRLFAEETKNDNEVVTEPIVSDEETVVEDEEIIDEEQTVEDSDDEVERNTDEQELEIEVEIEPQDNSDVSNSSTEDLTQDSDLNDWMPDLGLQAEIAKTLKINIADLNETSILRLDTLRISSSKTDFDLTGLDRALNLKNLYINQANSVTNVEIVNQLPKLEHLEIRANLTYLPILNSESLIRLRVPYNNISKIEGPMNLPNLIKLSISSNQIESLEAFSTLYNLKDIEIASNPISELNVLENFPNLERIYIGSDNVPESEFARFSAFQNLEFLHLGNTSLTTLDSIPTLPNLNALYMNYAAVTNLNNIGRFEKLDNINITYSALEDISGVSEVYNLRLFTVFSNPGIKDYSPLDNLTGIEGLDIRNNPLGKLEGGVDFVKKHKNLKSLVIENSFVENLDFVTELPNLRTLWAGGNRISDITILNGNTTLESVKLEQQRIDDDIILKKNTYDITEKITSVDGSNVEIGANSGINARAHYNDDKSITWTVDKGESWGLFANTWSTNAVINGRNVNYSGRVYKSFEREKKTIIINYRDQEGNMIADSKELTGFYGDTQSVATAVSGWTFMGELPMNVVFEDGTDEVNLVYTQTKGGTVTINYVDTTGEPIQDPKTITGFVNDPFNVTADDIYGWSLKKTTGVTSGKLTTKEQTITFTYGAKRVQPLYIYFLDENGESIRQRRRITGNFGDTYEYEIEKVTGYDYATHDGTLSGTFDDTAKYIEVHYTLAEGAPVTLNYVDENGNTLKESETLTGMYGEWYFTSPAEIKNWEFQTGEGSMNGKFTDEPKTITFIYGRIAAQPITVRYVEFLGDDIQEPTYINGYQGDRYTVEIPDIKGWTIDSTEGSTMGYLDDKPHTTTISYRRIAPKSVTVNYINTDGEILKEPTTITGNFGDPYNVSAPQINGWKHIETQGETQGEIDGDEHTITFVYEIPDAAPITVRFVDEANNSLRDTVLINGKIGDTFSIEIPEIKDWIIKEIDGELEGVLTDSATTVTVTYERKQGMPIIIKLTDENGTEIAKEMSIQGYVGERYIIKAPQIEGYTFKGFLIDGRTSRFMRTLETSLEITFDETSHVVSVNYTKDALTNSDDKETEVEASDDLPNVDIDISKNDGPQLPMTGMGTSLLWLDAISIGTILLAVARKKKEN